MLSFSQMKQFSVFLILSLLLLNLSVQAQTLKPGVWKGKVTFRVNGIPLPSTQDEDCILPHEVKNIKSSISKNLKKRGCSLTKWDIKGQKLEAALICKNKELDATGSMHGNFTEKHYKLEGEASGTYREMLPASATLVLQGDWVKTCN